MIRKGSLVTIDVAAAPTFLAGLATHRWKVKDIRSRGNVKVAVLDRRLALPVTYFKGIPQKKGKK